MNRTSLATLIFIPAIVVDSLLSDVSSNINEALPETIRIILFSTILGIAVFSASFVVLDYSKKVKVEIGSKSYALLLVSRIVPIIQYAIIVLLVLITIQIITSFQYLIFLLIASLALSWTFGVTMMGMMTFKFIQWYKEKTSILVLLYLISSLMLGATLGATIIPQLWITAESSSLYVNSSSTEIKPFQSNPQTLDSLFAVISIANWLVVPLWFILWAATAVMLNNYSRIFGRGKYWIMLSIPLLAVIIGEASWLVFLPSSIWDQEVIIYTFMAFGGLIAGGFLLAFAFLTISKNIQDKTSNSKISNYLYLSAIGISILFVSFFANPSAASYLPFGLLSSSFFGFGAYLYFAGIYSSAISISSDTKLRQSIRQSFLDQSKLLDSIGLADINRELRDQVDDLVRKHEEEMKKETGINASPSDLEIKNYINEVIAEIRRSKEGK